MLRYLLTYSTDNLIMNEKLVLGGTWTGDLPIFSPDTLASAPSRQGYDAGCSTLPKKIHMHCFYSVFYGLLFQLFKILKAPFTDHGGDHGHGQWMQMEDLSDPKHAPFKPHLPLLLSDSQAISTRLQKKPGTRLYSEYVELFNKYRSKVLFFLCLLLFVLKNSAMCMDNVSFWRMLYSTNCVAVVFKVTIMHNFHDIPNNGMIYPIFMIITQYWYTQYWCYNRKTI